MSRIHVVLDPASVPIFARLVGFFHGGPLDQAWIFDSPTDQWIALTEDHQDANVLRFNWFDHPLDGTKILRVIVYHGAPVSPHSGTSYLSIDSEVHTYHLGRFRVPVGNVAVWDCLVYRLEGTERPTALPSGFWLEAAYRKRTRQTPEHFYDRILGRFPGDDAPRWRDSHASDPLSDIMEARRLLLETDRFQGDSPQVRHSDPLTSAAYWREFFASVPGARHDIGSSTACFECGATVKTEHIWLKKNDPNIAMCEGCFRTAEAAGRAKDAG